MNGDGLRARKKVRTRQHLAQTAARLFGEHGYENVAIVDVARAAEVSEQTVYNYFPTKRDLVLDRDEVVRNRFVTRVRERPAGTSPAAAIRDEAVGLAESIRHIPHDELTGSLGYLAIVSPTVRRLSLEMTDRLANALAAVIVDTSPEIRPGVAKIHAIALAWISQTVIDEGGRHIQQGQTPGQIADELGPLVVDIVDDLDRRLGEHRLQQ
ncbi:MAG: TetR/AcrR family transcriptional regulator [Tomitella sp.]|nr:TetR/AcrR family transcriptional regulator [Tomitella sp.]